MATSRRRRTRSNEQCRSHHSRDRPTGRSLWGRGERCGAQRSNTQEAILRQLDVGGHSVLVMGVSPRPGDQLFFGQLPAELLERAECSVLFVASEPPTSAQSPEKSRDLAVQRAGRVQDCTRRTSRIRPMRFGTATCAESRQAQFNAIVPLRADAWQCAFSDNMATCITRRQRMAR